MHDSLDHPFVTETIGLQERLQHKPPTRPLVVVSVKLFHPCQHLSMQVRLWYRHCTRLSLWCRLLRHRVQDRLCPCHDGLHPACVCRITLMYRQPPGEGTSRVLSRQASSNRGPESFQPRWRHAHASHTVQGTRHEPCFGDLTCHRPVFLVELNLGHPLLDFGQPRVLRSALPRSPRLIGVNAQDASVRDNRHAKSAQL